MGSTPIRLNLTQWLVSIDEAGADLKVLEGFYEVIGGGETEEEAWASAFEYLTLTPKEQW